MSWNPKGKIGTFARREYIGAIAGILGAGASIYGSVSSANAANSAPGGLDPNDLNNLLLRRPLGNESILGQLSLQTLFELGVPVGALEEELLSRKLSEVKSPESARNVVNLMGQIRQLSAQGDTKHANKKLAKLNKKLRKVGAIAQIGQDGQPTFKFLGPEQQQIDQLKAHEAEQSDRFSNRLNAMTQIDRIVGGFADSQGTGQIPAEQQASQYLNSFVDEQQRLENDRIQAQANKLGISPGGQLSELDRAVANKRFQIANGGALERALALAQGQIGTIQQGLQPANLGATQNAAQNSSNDILQALQLGLGLSTANAQAEAARSAGLANSYSSIGQSGASLASGASNYLSSKALAEALGRQGTGS